MLRHWDLGRDQEKLKKERNRSRHQFIGHDHFGVATNLSRSRLELSKMQ